MVTEREMQTSSSGQNLPVRNREPPWLAATTGATRTGPDGLTSSLRIRTVYHDSYQVAPGANDTVPLVRPGVLPGHPDSIRHGENVTGVPQVMVTVTFEVNIPTYVLLTTVFPLIPVTGSRKLNSIQQGSQA